MLSSESNVLRATLRTFSTALRTPYEPRTTYSGPVHLLLADENKMDQDAKQQQHELIVAGWRRWAPNLVYTCAQGNHVTMLEPPDVFDLAERVRHLLLT